MGIVRQAEPTPQQRRKAYLKAAYEHGYQDGVSGRLRANADYFGKDEEAEEQYRHGLRIGRRERARG